MSVGPMLCELVLILYRTPFSTDLIVNNKNDAVTVCLFRIFNLKQIILNPITVAKHLVVLTVLEYSCDFRKETTHRNQQLQRPLLQLSAHVLR